MQPVKGLSRCSEVQIQIYMLRQSQDYSHVRRQNALGSVMVIRDNLFQLEVDKFLRIKGALFLHSRLLVITKPIITKPSYACSGHKQEKIKWGSGANRRFKRRRRISACVIAHK